ncbi:MAG: hypothetical protein CMJ25_29180 [Phycisphaerae bacterium]|nr:hypothetical protein [Phycisphaerae bacterium]|tara:strand:+ start:750 stop:1436 length:687 start_codon:yes stop_codon:yes gene_type:complete
MGILEDGLDALGGLFKKDDGSTDYGSLISLGGAVLGGTGILGTDTPSTGYQGTVPEYDVQREVVPGTYDPNRRPGSGGQRYFTQTQYVPKSATPAQPMDAEGLAALNAANPARQERRRPGGPRTPIPVQDEVQELAAGGIAQLKKGQYLNGASDGMADKVPANIDGVQEARLSDGEFVIPADVVSHLGNGNSDAGAKVLKDMMSRVRKARTGNTKQGKEIDPKKFIPA